MLVLSQSASWMMCGTCRLFANPYDGILIPAVAVPGGFADVWLPLLTSGLQGLTFHAQWLVHNPSPSATCSWLQADLSNPLSITIE